MLGSYFSLRCGSGGDICGVISDGDGPTGAHLPDSIHPDSGYSGRSVPSGVLPSLEGR